MSRNMTGMEVFEIICLRLNSSAAYNKFFFYVTEGLNVSKHDREKQTLFTLYNTSLRVSVHQFIDRGHNLNVSPIFSPSAQTPYSKSK